MEAWRCSECDRLFARRGQSHDCAPGLTLEEYFATGSEHERAVFDAVMDHVDTLGPVHADFVAVGVFLKNPKKFADLRPKQQWVALGFSLERQASHRTITRKIVPHGERFWHVANIRSSMDLDQSLAALITEAYDVAIG